MRVRCASGRRHPPPGRAAANVPLRGSQEDGVIDTCRYCTRAIDANGNPSNAPISQDETVSATTPCAECRAVIESGAVAVDAYGRMSCKACGGAEFCLHPGMVHCTICNHEERFTRPRTGALTLVQCCSCGRVCDSVAKRTDTGLVCRFCQSATEGRCLMCGSPGEPWPMPDSRFTSDLSFPHCDKCAGRAV